MILPEPKTDGRRQRLIAVTGAVALMVGMHAGLRGTPVPLFGSSRGVIRELDPLFLEKYAVPPPPPPDENAAPDEDTPEQPSGSATLDQEIGMAIDELARRFGREGGQPVGDAPARSAPLDGVSGIESNPDDARFAELFGASDEPAVVTAPRGRAEPGREAPAGAGIEVATRRGRRAPNLQSRTERDAIEVPIEAPTARVSEAVPATEVAIKEYEPESFGGSEVDALTEWMQTHQADLPVGMKVHLNYLPSFLTATAPFTSNGRPLELYLMFNRSLRELHIVLVDGDQSVYLIDRGFEERSRSLREGTVRRLEGEIVAVDSRAGAASSDRAKEFYNVFLSWWEVAKQDVRR